MIKRAGWLILLITLSFFSVAYGQEQDVDFHLNAHLLAGQNLLKVKRDFHDIYLWVLGENNKVYRVNSQTLAVNDYSAAFSAYSNLNFIDIMGRSADSVLIATSSANVIEYLSGSVKLLGSSDGIPGKNISLGIDLGFNGENSSDAGLMLIATDNGIRTFDPKKQTLGYLFDVAPFATSSDIAQGHIYESTYRTLNYKDSTAGDIYGSATDTLQYLPVVYNTAPPYSTYSSLVCSYVWKSQYYGKTVNTVLALNDAVYGNSDGYFASYFWGTERGMWQAPASSSYNQANDLWKHYLDGIKVNKITDIMGLTSFSNFYESDFIKQNLLIGTDNGFYFSSTAYNEYGTYPPPIALFHDDELGSTVINDICVNVVPDAVPICENGVWLASLNGLYLLKPDYGAYTGSQQKKFITFNYNGQPDTLSQIQVCSGSKLSAIANNYYNNIQWYKNGAEVPAASKDTLDITAAGDYSAVIYDPCEGIHIESNHLTVTMLTGPQFTFNYPDKLQYCDSTSATLNVTSNPSYHYRWYQNDVLNGDTTATLTTSQSGKYKVEVSACTNSWVPSKEVEVDLVNLPEVLITPDKNVYCSGDNATLSINAPVDPSYTISWYKDNNLIQADNNLTSIITTDTGAYEATITSNIAGCSSSSTYQLAFTSAPTFTFNYPAELNYCAGSTVNLSVQGNPNYQYRWYRDDVLTGNTAQTIPVMQSGKYKVEVSACANSWIPSSEVQVNFIQLPVPVIAADKPAYCIGDNATLNLPIVADPDYTINWYRDNVLLPDANQNSITTNIPGNYTVVINSNITSTDGSTCPQTSNPVSISFNAPPTVSIDQIPYSTFCQGVAIQLKADYTSGTLKWSTGETADHIDVTTSGTYTVTLTSTSGCATAASTNVTFFPDPVLNVNDTTICTYKHQSVTLTAPAGFAKYYWNAVPGGQTYTVTYPQTVKLTIEDVNNCETSRSIQITEQCPEVFIPNTFTPNGDGINDVWDIQGLDATAAVKIFNRYGAMLYQSKGYNIPWDGTYQAKKLPTGTYYYIINVKNGTQTFSGSVTILY